MVVSQKCHVKENGDCHGSNVASSITSTSQTVCDGRTNRSSAHDVDNSTQPSRLSQDYDVHGLDNSALTPSPVKQLPHTKEDKMSNDAGAVKYAESPNALIYEAESPDEAALVKAASCYGYRLISRSPDSVIVFVPGEGEVRFEILHILAFDSSRKRMSVVVRNPKNGNILLYCKGADSAIMSHLATVTYTANSFDNVDSPDGLPRNLVDVTETHLNGYAKDGLRTLCMARKVCKRNILRQ